MSSAVITPSAIAAQAIEGRSWTAAWASNLATPSTWPALSGSFTLAPTGVFDFEQKTPGLRAEGAGSARLDKAVVPGALGRWLSGATAYTSPAANPLLVRLIFRETRLVGNATYFEIGQAAQRLTIRRTTTTLNLTANLGAYTETIYFEPFVDRYALLDVVLGPTGIQAWLNGIDLTPSFAGAVVTAFGGAAQIALLNNLAGSEVALNTELVFAGVKTSPTLTIQQHRDDARQLDVLEDGLIYDLGGYTWLWSPSRVDDETIPTPSLPGDPDFGDIDARLSIDGSVEFDQPTGILRPEGLGKPQIARAFKPTEDTDVVQRPAPSGFEAVDGDLHLRLVFTVDSAGTGVQQLFYLEDADATKRLGVEVDTSNGNLILRGPSGYNATLAAAVALDEQHLLDVSLDRDNGGGVAAFVAHLDGNALAPAAHGTLVSDIPEDAAVTFFDDATNDGAATATTIAFAAITRGRVHTLARHRLDALALGVML